jgi:hypothetical protein
MEIPARMTKSGRMCPAFLVDDEVARYVQALKWSLDRQGYLRARFRGRIYKIHRFVWKVTKGAWPVHAINHINDNKLDNRMVNLEDIPAEENTSKARHIPKRKKSSLPVGVCRMNQKYRSRPFQAQIWINRKSRLIGYFATPEEASAAYQAAKKSLLPPRFHPNPDQ